MRAYVTVLNSDSYVLGVKALSKSLQSVKSIYPLIVLIPSSKDDLVQLLRLNHVLNSYCKVVVVEDETINYISNQNKEYISNSIYPWWISTFFKLTALNLIQYEKIVLIDSDVMVLKNLDSIFEKPSFSAVLCGKCIHPEWRGFSSGLMVIEPNRELYRKSLQLIDRTIIFKMSNGGLPSGDQDIYNALLPNWYDNNNLHIPEFYHAVWSYIDNVCDVERVNYNQIKSIHFSGTKPFHTKHHQQILTVFHYLKHGQIWKSYAYARYLMYLYGN